MAGKKGMQHRSARSGTLRRKVWTSMRILRRFTVPDICRTIPGDFTYTNIRKFVQSLERHGYLVKCAGYVGGRAGECQQYRLVKDIGPEYPTVCERCKQSLAAPCVKKETEKEKEREKEALAAGGER